MGIKTIWHQEGTSEVPDILNQSDNQTNILNQSDNAKSQLAKFFRQSGVLLMGDAYMRPPIGCRTGEWANVFSM